QNRQRGRDRRQTHVRPSKLGPFKPNPCNGPKFRPISLNPTLSGQFEAEATKPAIIRAKGAEPASCWRVLAGQAGIYNRCEFLRISASLGRKHPDFVSLAVTITPARQAARPRLGLEDAARDGARQRGGRDRAKLGEFVHRIGKGSASGRRGEYGVTVERRMGRVDGAGK